MTDQQHYQIVDIVGWAKEERYEGVFAKGAREKRALYSPHSTEFEFLIPNFPYLFKESFRNIKTPGYRYPWQFWIEIFAFRFGKLIEVDVPPAFVAFDSGRGIYAALIQWFYHTKDDVYKEQYTDGGNIMTKLIPQYDSKNGAQHNLTSILELEDQNQDIFKGMYHDYWATTLVFDALLGDTDRHHDNWGMIRRVEHGRPLYRLSPAFDNGTSMGYEIFEEKLSSFSQDKIIKYITNAKAKHHIRWDLSDNVELNHFQMVEKYLQTFPQYYERIKKLVSFDLEGVKKILFDLRQFKIEMPLSEQRSSFMLELIQARQTTLKGVLEL